MIRPAKPGSDPAVAGRPDATARHRWLLLVHQLPPRPTNVRVKTWRRLQQLGAVAVKNSVYVLPNSAAAREDFEWLKTEVEALGGQASVFAADSIDAWSDDDLVDEFQRARQQDYDALARDVDRALRSSAAGRPPRGARLQRLQRAARQLRERLARIDAIDFFASAGRDRATDKVAQLEDRLAAGSRPPREAPAGQDALDVSAYRGRIWVTRPRPGIDRIASAWLIRRFIDPQAHFDFVESREDAGHDQVPFDMFGVEFSHHGDACTFETLMIRFGLTNPAVARLAQIVHDLDLKDDRYGPPEAATIGQLIEGLRLAHDDDHELVERGLTLFEALYRAFEEGARRDRRQPRAVARRPRRPRRGA